MTARRISAPDAGLRLDALLAKSGVAPSAAAARRLIADGAVRVDGRRARKGLRLRVGQVVEVEGAPAITSGHPMPCPEIPLVVLHEDADIIAVAKPAGLPSHPLRPEERPTLAGAIVARYPECAGASADPREGGLGHRLDTGTSGVVLAARNPEAWRRLREALGAADCEKVYVAEVVGLLRLPADGRQTDRAVVTAPIGRAGRRGCRVRVGSGRHPLPAQTEIRIIERRDATTLVEARLAKGRPHQVRAHLAFLDAPVVGDTIYGRATRQDEVAGLRLHALTVSLRHPITGRPLRVEAPAPPWADRLGPKLPHRAPP